MQRVDSYKSFSGVQEVWTHQSTSLNCEMRFGVYLPPQASSQTCPVLYFLSGLTCTEQNFITKSGFQRYAAEHGIIVVCPDTSPRGDDVADDEGWDLGKGAGFYVNATQEPWAAHYQMYDYVVSELPEVVNDRFPNSGDRSISGHSMGGHGALVIALRNAGMFKSVSAFSPITAPASVPWGEKAFGAYLGDDREQWGVWDASVLVGGAQEQIPMLIDQGDADSFLEVQLKTEVFVKACKSAGYAADIRSQPGYDHSFYFISTFIGDHFVHHAKALNGG